MKDFEVNYKRATWAIWHFWWTRTALTVLVCMCTEAGGGRPVVNAFSGIFSVVGAAIAFYAIISFLLMCKHTPMYMYCIYTYVRKNVHMYCKNRSIILYNYHFLLFVYIVCKIRMVFFIYLYLCSTIIMDPISLSRPRTRRI